MMQQAEIHWSHDTTRDVFVARLSDTEGHAWTAIIQCNPLGHKVPVVAILSCRSVGRYLSTNTQPNVEAAQQWCYDTLGLT